MNNNRKIKTELYNDNFQNYKRYGIPKAQLVIADIPYNLGANAYASSTEWYVGGDNKNGESKKAKKVIATNVITNETKVYGSMIETKSDGFQPSEVSRSCNHGGTHHGYVFRLI